MPGWRTLAIIGALGATAGYTSAQIMPGASVSRAASQPMTTSSPPRPSSAITHLDTIRCASRQAGGATEVAVVDFFGAIGASFNSDAVYRLVNGITQDATVGAIILRINSTGGDSYGAKRLYQVVRDMRTTCNLPMAAFIGNVGTSGGFWLAMAADEVHADPLSTVGAVGIVAVYQNEAEKHARQGTPYTVIRTGERKWPLLPYLPVAADDVKKVKDSLGIVLDEFITAVEQARRGKLKLDRTQLATGEAWMGRDAIALGLVDEPAGFDATAARLLGRPPEAYRMHDLARAAGSGASPDAGPQPALISRN